MENRLHALFEFQKFHGNKRLEKLIKQAEQNTTNKLDDDALGFVAAAGEPSVPKKEDVRHDA